MDLEYRDKQPHDGAIFGAACEDGAGD